MAFVGCELKFIMKQPLVVTLSLICALTIIMAVITTCRGELQFIVPSENLYCHTQSPCVTLDTFVTLNVTEVETANRTNLSLELLPGNHKLTSELIVVNLRTFTMSSNGTNFVSVTCSQLGRMIFVNIDEVSIIGLRFSDCGQNEVKIVNKFLLTDSIFHGGVNTGTALIVSDSSADFSDSQFLNNTQGMNYTYNNTQVISGEIEEVQVRVGGAVYITHSEVTLSKCSFNGNSADNGGSLFIDDNSIVNITNSTFSNNSGTVIYTINSTVHSEGSTIYENNTAINGAVAYSVFSNLSFHRCVFYGNKAEKKSGVVFMYRSIISLNGCEVIENSADSGGAMQLLYGTLEIKESIFIRNSADNVGAVLNIENCSMIITDSLFSHNWVDNFGILHMATSVLLLSNTTLSYNTVKNKGVINAQDSTIESRDLNIIGNYGKMSIVHLVRCNATFSDMTTFKTNTASFMVINCNVTFKGSNNIFEGNFCDEWCSNRKNWKVGRGAITTIRSRIDFQKQTTFKDNHSKNRGGGIYAVESFVTLHGDVSVEFNQAEYSGGGVYLYRSTLSCKGNLYITGNEVVQSEGLGGGVHAISSSIQIRGHRESFDRDWFDRKLTMVQIRNKYPQNTLTFNRNHAKYGGGMCFESYSKLYIIGVRTVVRFENNTALLGGAIFVNYNETKSICASKDFKMLNAKSEYFFQQLYYIKDGYKKSYLYRVTSIQFEGNLANHTGSILFGGLLDRCTVSLFQMPTMNSTLRLAQLKIL